jgi:hypothetical protein
VRIPEIGGLGREPVATVAEVAPYDDDSGACSRIALNFPFGQFPASTEGSVFF